MRPTRGKKKAPKTPKKPPHRRPDDEFVEIDWDLINNMPDANSHSEDTTVVEEISLSTALRMTVQLVKMRRVMR